MCPEPRPWNFKFGSPKADIPYDTEKGVITKGVFSLEQSPESLKSPNSLESLENGRILLCFPESGGDLESLEFLDSLETLETLENGLFRKTPFFPTKADIRTKKPDFRVRTTENQKRWKKHFGGNAKGPPFHGSQS